MCKSWNEIIQQDECARLKERTYLREVDAGLEVRFGLLAERTTSPDEYSDCAVVFSVRGSLPGPRGRDQAHASEEVGPQDCSGPVS